MSCSSARSSRRKKLSLDHPIFTRRPAQYPDRLQLFSAPTPNGVKVSIMLEETSLEYEPHRIDILADESHGPAFLALNPNAKIPAIYDPDGPSGTPLALFSLLGWVRNLIGFYEAHELVGYDRFVHVQAWLNRGLAWTAVQRGLQVTAV
jgi:hypothetical protein